MLVSCRLLFTGRWSIESVHGGIDPLSDPDGDRLRCQDQSVIDGVSFGAAEPAQDVVGGIDAFVLADSDPEAWELVGPQLSRDVAQTFLTAVRPSGTEPKFADGQAEIIAHDQEVGDGQLVKPHRLADRTATQIHERLGLQKQDAPVIDLDLGLLTLELAGERRLATALRQAIDKLEADIMPCSLVLAARVAQADHQFDRRQNRGPRQSAQAVFAVMTGRPGPLAAIMTATISLPCLFPCVRV